ncbi:hypothetical protein BABINDRAFT_159881 [Babjeviella inositovora NRRL Y-12698]|uniref:Major facilitator superfamily (MFS) profile domain-containing protein n=1 Tax=Babjeviella inositovora NRRL Y-12698 TaxID=984486 RepID=A0A1E3QX09_9ASCO|nr:uncharacterized protein BABINDRAFT_159881 [Babjeviella inositovora NRRL Y-12698]ODQ81612.1 hypothetical protein BABINDRAFT_159881 [Babjeviella inositovora NRRL Y-12698]
MATRDLPTSFTSWVPRARAEMTILNRRKMQNTVVDDVSSHHYFNANDEVFSGGSATVDMKNEKLRVSSKPSKWPIFTAGAGLFSDGYVNNSIGTASTCLRLLYPKQYATSNVISNVSSIAFAGTVLGQLVFGYISDYHSRKLGMMVSTVILIIFAILCAGSWGKNASDANGLFTALTVYRFFLGVGIGGEYPAGSVACAEASALMPPSKRNRWFCWFTNFMIDFGFVVSAVVPYILLVICGKDHLTPVWRITLGLGAIPPLSLFFLRLKFKEGEQFTKLNFKRTRVPYWSVIKFYWFRLTIVSLVWFIYDFSAYAFGIYSSYIIAQVIPDGDLYKTFGWNIVLNLFYIPGAFLGAISADYFGPRLTLSVGVILQALVGFIMAAKYETLRQHTGPFVVVYGIFMTLGEFGPGDNIGLLASKTSATAIRGQYYGIAAAIGKIGAFVGTWVFPVIIKNAGGADTTAGNQAPFWVASSLCIFSGLMVLFLLPRVDTEAIQEEDSSFLTYLESTGFDISLLGDVGSLEEEMGQGSLTSKADVEVEIREKTHTSL